MLMLPHSTVTNVGCIGSNLCVMKHWDTLIGLQNQIYDYLKHQVKQLKKLEEFLPCEIDVGINRKGGVTNY